MSDSTEADFDLAKTVADVLSSLSEGRIEDALAAVDALAKRLGGTPLVFHLVGLTSLRLNEPGKAVEAFLSAHHAEPETREYNEALSIVLSKVGRLVDSLYHQKLAIAATRELGIPGILPDWMGNFAEAFASISEAPLMKAAEAAFARGDYPAAISSFQKETEVAPDSTAAWRGLILSYLLDGKPFESVAAAEKLVALGPDDADHQALLGRCLAHAGRFEDALAVHRRAESLRPRDADLAWQSIMTAAERPGIALSELTRFMTRWGERFLPPAGAAPKPERADLATRRLRLGIISSHWADGDGLDTLIPVIELLDRKRIELFCYAGGVVDASLAVRARQRANAWCDLRELDEATTIVVVANDELDILLDLDGPTRGAHPTLFAARPAALALSVYGIAAGAPALGFDGVIGDPAAYETEAPGRVLRISGGLATLPSNLTPLERPARAGAPIVFGSLAHFWQIGPETVAAWSAILDALPAATLVLDRQRLGGLKGANELANRYGTTLPPDRVMTADPGDNLVEYLMAVDLLLDPLDNPQPDEALAALTLGVPVLTCRSAMPRASMLATWLETAGLAELGAGNAPDYIAAAAGLAAPGGREAIAACVAAAVESARAAGPSRQAAALGAALYAAAVSPT